jgi:hypothetical protein
MPVEQYIKTKLPKDRLPFRELQSGGLAYMLGEPTYMKYGVGGSVGHAPWLKPTAQPQPQQQLDTPMPNVASKPDPLKAPRGIPSLAPKNMDPQYMQQQMMQKAMMGQGAGNTGQGPRPMAAEGGRIGYAGGGIFKLLKMLKSKPKSKEIDVAALKKKYGLDPESAKKDDEAFKLRLQQILAKHSTKHAEGGIIRTAFKDGGDMSRRGFLKLMAGIAALPVIGKYFKAAKLAKPAATAASTIIKSNAAGMPIWFPKAVERVIKEGKDISKTAGTIERQTVHTMKLPESGTEVMVTRDLVTDDIIMDIGMGKHGFGAGRHGQPAQLVLKKGQWAEPDVTKAGKVKGKGQKEADEFYVDEAEFTGGHPENIKFEESAIEKYGDHASDFSEVERFAVGKNIDKKIVGKKRVQDEWAEGRAESAAEDVDYAKGGLAYLLGE